MKPCIFRKRLNYFCSNQQETRPAKLICLNPRLNQVQAEQVEIRHGTILRPPSDVLAYYLEAFNSSVVDFEGFFDIYNLIYFIQICIKGNLSLTDAINKAKKDVTALQAIDEFTFEMNLHSNPLCLIILVERNLRHIDSNSTVQCLHQSKFEEFSITCCAICSNIPLLLNLVH